MGSNTTATRWISVHARWRSPNGLPICASNLCRMAAIASSGTPDTSISSCQWACIPAAIVSSEASFTCARRRCNSSFVSLVCLYFCSIWFITSCALCMKRHGKNENILLFYELLEYQQQCRKHAIAQPSDENHQLFQAERQLIPHRLLFEIQQCCNLFDALLLQSRQFDDAPLRRRKSVKSLSKHAKKVVILHQCALSCGAEAVGIVHIILETGTVERCPIGVDQQMARLMNTRLSSVSSCLMSCRWFHSQTKVSSTISSTVSLWWQYSSAKAKSRRAYMW